MKKEISLENFENANTRVNYRFATIEIDCPVEYSEKETGKKVEYIASKAHQHASRSGKKFKTYSYKTKNDKFLRVLRVL